MNLVEPAVMYLVDARNAESYLRQTNRVAAGKPIRVTPLPGGVSNIVLQVAADGARTFVLKQARYQLRVPRPWYCRVERILREMDVLQICRRLLEEHDASNVGDCAVEATVPEVLFEDRPNFLYAMTAAPPGHQVWKQQLLAGVCRPEVARACGDLLATLHGETWRDPHLAQQLADRSFFEDLRVDPYYREVARQDESLRPFLDQLMQSLPANCLALVHGDFSPKNLLVHGRTVMLVDFEVGHYGDPAFDVGFFLSHLMLKSFRAGPAHPSMLALWDAFADAYLCRVRERVAASETEALQRRAVEHLAACGLARIAGKSQVEYLPGEQLRRQVRSFCLDLHQHPAHTLQQAAGRLRHYLHGSRGERTP